MSVETLNNFQMNACCVEKKATTDLKGRFLSMLKIISVWSQRYHSRRELAKLDERILHDIGLSAADVEAERQKPFWVK